MSTVARPEFQCKQPYGATSARALQVFPLQAPSPFGSTIAQWQCIARPRPQGPCGTASTLFPISWLRAALQVYLPFHVAVNSRRHNLAQHGSPRGHSHGSRKLHSHSYIHSPLFPARPTPSQAPLCSPRATAASTIPKSAATSAVGVNGICTPACMRRF